MSFLDPAIQVTLLDVAEEDRAGEIPADPIVEANAVIERGVERARGARLQRRPQGCARARPVRRSSREAIEGKFDAIFMSLRGVYRRGDTSAFASNTRYVLENAPCRVILGFAPKSIPAQVPATAMSLEVLVSRSWSISASSRSLPAVGAFSGLTGRHRG